ncbi:MAG: GFA family protein [Pseudomonadota bacterium]
MAHTGSCMCGAVSFRITTPITETGACHCEMCRKWTGGVYISVAVPPEGMEMDGEEHLHVFTSSPWAERVSCKTCGGNLFYRVTAAGPMQGEMHVGLGTLDDASGIPFTGELFIDLKPDSYAFEGGTDRRQLTQAEVEAMFADYAP